MWKALNRPIPSFFLVHSAQVRWKSTCCQSRLKQRMAEISACVHSPAELEYDKPIVRKRKVIEHVVLFQMKEGFTEEQEKDMLDHLYTLQYQLRGVITVSLGGHLCNSMAKFKRYPSAVYHMWVGETGSTTTWNVDGCTHGLFMRFPSREALECYYDSPARWKVANEYIIPYYNGLICVDFEAEVEDDLEPIFRRGEAFEQGVESLLLLQATAETDPRQIQESFDSLSALVEELGMLVVQHTSGANISSFNKGYTHGMVTRFPSEEARDIFLQHPSYVEIMESKLLPTTLKMLSVEYGVAPVGTTAF